MFWPILFSLLTVTGAQSLLASPTHQPASTVQREPLSNPELIPGSSTVMIGQTASLRCLSRDGSLPITYTLFLMRSTRSTKTVSKEREATFSIVVYNRTSLGPYQCKATNSRTPGGVYSKTVTFRLPEPLVNPELIPSYPSTEVGDTVTIRCLCRQGSPPVTFTLFHQTSARGTKTVTSEREAAFHVTMNNLTDLGPYKCKANNSVTAGAYSQEFTFTLLEPLSNPELIPEHRNVTIGQNVTILCLSKNGSPFITYTLYLNVSVRDTRTVSKPEGARFSITISDQSSLGPYKCKANNSATSGGKYSNELTFTLQESIFEGPQITDWFYRGWPNLVRIIGLLILITVTASVTFCPCGKAGSPPSSEQPPPSVQNVGINLSTKDEAGRWGSGSEDVQYCTMALGAGSSDRRSTPQDQETSSEQNVYENVISRETGGLQQSSEDVEYSVTSVTISSGNLEPL